MSQTNSWMFTGAATAKIFSSNYYITSLYFLGEILIEIYKKIWHYSFRSRTENLICEISSKHLICIQIIHISIIPDACFPSVIIRLNVHSCALCFWIWIFICKSFTTRVDDLTFNCRMCNAGRRSQIYLSFFVSHSTFEISVCSGNYGVSVSRNSLSRS